MLDGGPVYAETHLHRWIVEPWNAASCLGFLVLAGYWVIRLRGRYRQFLFLSACLPVMVMGGVGGTLYHAFRAHRVFLMMDIFTILILALASGIYLWTRLPRGVWAALAVVPSLVLFQMHLFGHLPHGWGINVSYAMLAALILVPALLVLWQRGFRDGRVLLLAVGLFAAAVFFRAADRCAAPYLPMGTHWFWHLFGAAACQALAEFLYRLGGGGPSSRRLVLAQVNQEQDAAGDSRQRMQQDEGRGQGASARVEGEQRETAERCDAEEQ